MIDQTYSCDIGHLPYAAIQWATDNNIPSKIVFGDDIRRGKITTYMVFETEEDFVYFSLKWL